MKTIDKHYLHITIPINNCFSLTLRTHTRYINIDIFFYRKQFLWWKYNNIEMNIHTDYLVDPFYDGEYNTNSSLESNTKAIRDYIESVCKAYKKGIADFEEVKVMISSRVKQYNGICIDLEDYREDI